MAGRAGRDACRTIPPLARDPVQQDRGRLPPGRPTSLRANQGHVPPGWSPAAHGKGKTPCTWSGRHPADPDLPHAAKTPCTNSPARRRHADRATRGPASSRRAAKTSCTNSPSQPPPRPGDRQKPWRRRDRGSRTVRTGPLGKPGDASPRQHPMHLSSHRRARARGNTPCPAAAARSPAASARRRRRGAAARGPRAARTPCTCRHCSARWCGNTPCPAERSATPHAQRSNRFGQDRLRLTASNSAADTAQRDIDETLRHPPIEPTPMHQFARPPPLRRPTGPEADGNEVRCRNPMHQFMPSSRQEAQRQATPHAQQKIAHWATRTVSRVDF